MKYLANETTIQSVNDLSTCLSVTVKGILPPQEFVRILGLHECKSSCRIQVWPFHPNKLPEIFDANRNIVVEECIICNEAAIDISKDGRKIVVIVPDLRMHQYKVAVYSLLPQNLGQLLCMYGPVPNPVSVSFSPLSQYIFIGMASISRDTSKEPGPDAEIISIKEEEEGGGYKAVLYRRFSQIYHGRGRIRTYSLNAVRWLPARIPGFCFATNKGSLVICTPEDNAQKKQQTP
ncbi:activating molecule in BECN1-regulated autophagy protein 1 [Trichonephila clavata]|uniref:Activating molecule in BECN1-regulated autophagy protein 1 n=1 Tax=Trichonephila clavata TaxID=2740835 RepID=A0A8X6LXN7_TRICU|nr:activating molecule in BECN1-regulated autophagy protein 1 [Trichonephila clavata]